MVQLYPDGYANFAPRLTIAGVRAIHPNMESEYGQRFFAAMVAADGLVGVGGGWRAVQPVKPGFAPPGMSFHETQSWRDGQRAWAAVDIIGVNARHGEARAWMERNGHRFGLMTFLNVNQEPWHIQASDIPAGYGTWARAGHPNPNPNFPLPGEPIPPIPPRPPQPINPPVEVGDMFLANPERRLYDSRTTGDRRPKTLYAIPTGLDPAVAHAAQVNITVVPQGVAGWLSLNPETSFCQFAEGKTADHEKALQVQPDGTVLFGASTPVHVIVDLAGEYH